MLNKLPITEIFYSIQGEGWDVGTASVFIRLSGCPVGCSFCDEQHKKSLGYMTVNQIIKKLDFFNRCQHVVFTGGEPLLPENLPGIEEIISVLSTRSPSYKITIETSGLFDPTDFIVYNSSITCSPKENCSWKICVGARYLKYVVTPSFDLTIPPKQWHNKIFLMPLYKDGKPDPESLTKTIEYVKLQPFRFRMSLQTHKHINIQ